MHLSRRVRLRRLRTGLAAAARADGGEGAVGGRLDAPPGGPGAGGDFERGVCEAVLDRGVAVSALSPGAHLAASAVPWTDRPSGYSDAGNQCSTFHRFPTRFQRSTRSSSNTMTTSPSLTVALPGEDRNGSTTEADPSSATLHFSTTPLANSTRHVPTGRPLFNGLNRGAPPMRIGRLRAMARMASVRGMVIPCFGTPKGFHIRAGRRDAGAHPR